MWESNPYSCSQGKRVTVTLHSLYGASTVNRTPTKCLQGTCSTFKLWKRVESLQPPLPLGYGSCEVSSIPHPPVEVIVLANHHTLIIRTSNATESNGFEPPLTVTTFGFFIVHWPLYYERLTNRKRKWYSVVDLNQPLSGYKPPSLTFNLTELIPMLL